LAAKLGNIVARGCAEYGRAAGAGRDRPPQRRGLAGAARQPRRPAPRPWPAWTGDEGLQCAVDRRGLQAAARDGALRGGPS